IPEIRRPVSCWHEASGTGKVICPATGTGSTISSTNRGKTPCRLPCSRLVIGSRERTGIDRALGSPPLKSVRDVEMFFRPIRDGGGRFDGESRNGLQTPCNNCHLKRKMEDSVLRYGIDLAVRAATWGRIPPPPPSSVSRALSGAPCYNWVGSKPGGVSWAFCKAGKG